MTQFDTYASKSGAFNAKFDVEASRTSWNKSQLPDASKKCKKKMDASKKCKKIIKKCKYSYRPGPMGLALWAWPPEIFKNIYGYPPFSDKSAVNYFCI